MTKEERDAVQARCVSIDNIIIGIERELRMLRTHLDILTKVCKTEQTEREGEWIEGKYDLMCSNCENTQEYGKFPYCPYCGAKMADRKTDSDSEIPNNCEVECEKCKHFREEADTYMKQCEYYFMECRFEPKDEPTISKMEQVDKDINVRSKDEPQTVRSNLEPFRVDEPQTERSE